ncbi:MAG TPA: thymidylate kinase [Clostridia bacterium]|nr:thymidylate kinase [Clostridia bacterium]
MTAGKLIVIEAPDGSGKKTQSELLVERLKKAAHPVKKVEFPNYKSPASALVKMYLQGDFGENPEAVNPYAASAFYAVDRFASFLQEWQEFYLKGYLIVADRYTTSNLIHQGVKFSSSEAREAFFTWVWDFEFKYLALPKPDLVFFLDMPPQYSQQLIARRKNKFTGKTQKDIHEINEIHLRQAYENACWLAEKYNWHKIACVKEGVIKPVSTIHEQIYTLLKKELKKA